MIAMTSMVSTNLLFRHQVVCDAFAAPWTVAHQVLLFMEFSRQKYWSRLPFPSPGDLPDPGIEPGSPTLEGDTLTSEPLEKPIQSEVSHKEKP